MPSFHTVPAALGKDIRGVSVVEFGLFAPILGLMVMGMADLSGGISAKLALEQAAHRALERASLGATQNGSDNTTVDYNYIAQEAATAAAEAGLPAPQVTMTRWLECNGTRQDEFAGSCAVGEEVGRHIKLRIVSAFTPNFSYGPLGTRFAGASSDGTVPIAVEASVRIQ